MGDALVGGQERGVEGLCCVGAGEDAGLAGWEEDLLASPRVDGEVVDGFMGGRVIWAVWCGREHGEDGVVVCFGQRLALVCMSVFVIPM